jgi:predicted DNA repair protein MutK|tara:strand:- start:624 stop:1568 length:945 start_codon:yes stop_codon:yes gene_type:complete
MAAANLLALIDDIATILDDVAVLSKVAAKKTAGVLGDDLALNAEQVSGVKAERELPVVWAVAKGSFLNKLILVPSALLISAFLPWLITVLLVIGGLYLCFEGFEKVAHKWLHSEEEREAEHQAQLNAIADPKVDLVALEKDKIKGAIRTDFILSAEIVVIVLGTVQAEPLSTQIAVVSALAIAITIGVYGLVAGIVKLDDAGLYMLRKSVSGSFNTIQRFIGRSLLIIAPMLMKSLAIIGTAAMFLVGGGIVVHSVPFIHHIVGDILHPVTESGGALASILPVVADGVVGIIAGGLVLLVVTLASKVINAIRGK